MRLGVLGIAFLLVTPTLLSLGLTGPGGSAGAEIPAKVPESVGVSAANEPDFKTDPRDGEWLRFTPSIIAIEVANASFQLALGDSTLQLDGEPRTVAWSATARTLQSVLFDPLPDGIHTVEAFLARSNGPDVHLAWSFGLDTESPEVELDPLVSVTESRSLLVQGRVSDAHLAGLTVQGRDVELEEGNFSTSILLWPGLNDVVVEGEDLAGNLGREIRIVRLLTDPFTEPTQSRVLPNSSFALDLPESWVAQEDLRLTSGNRADLVALAPLAPGLQTSLIVVSEFTLSAYPSARALQWMDLVIAGVEVSGDLVQVVSGPRLLDGLGTVAVQSTFLRQTAADRVSFMQITMVWSHLLYRQWILLASTDAQRVMERWPSLNATVASFRVLGEGLDGEPETQPQIVFSTALVIGASAVLLFILTAVLLQIYLARRREREKGRWRPPRNWGMP